MAEAPSYTTVPGRISDLLKKIRDTGVPPKATNDWLKSVGFTNSNDRTLVRVLRQIGFVDGSGVPQPAWREYRGSDHRSVLGRALVLGYDTLYAMYPDAHSRSTTDLAHFFSSKTDAGKQSISLMVTTFKNLAKEADFDAVPSNLGSSTGGTPDPRTNGDAGGGDSGGGGGEGSNVMTRTHTGGGVTININVQLTLPETKDEKVFDAFFSAMRRHLIDDNGS